MSPDLVRHVTWWAMCVAAVLLAAAGARALRSVTDGASGGPPPLPAPVLTAAAPTGPSRGPAVRRVPRLADRSAPTKIMIPAIRLRAAVDEIGLAPDGTIETPPYERASHAAWYRLGASPGERGPAVILGHVDSKKSVAVFFYLTRIRPGDQIQVVRADGRAAVFTVGSVEQFAKASFPTERVYGPTEGPELRLVTCGGRYDKRRGAYLDNIVVFAHLTDIRRAT